MYMRINTKRIKELCWLFVIMVIVVLSCVGAGKYLLKDNDKTVVTKYVDREEEPMEDIVKRVLEEEGIPWLDAFRIIECESRWDRYFKEKTKNGGYDRGLFAFNGVHYSQVSDDCAFDPECATRDFSKAYKNGNIADLLCVKVLGINKK